MKINAAVLQAGINSMKYRPAAGGMFIHPFGNKGYCEIHRGSAKTEVNGVCQGCSSKWNVKKVQDFLNEQRIKHALPKVTTRA